MPGGGSKNQSAVKTGLLTGQILVALDEVAHHIRICQGGDVAQAVKLIIGDLS